MDDVRVLRDDDPSAASLLEVGWTPLTESWGARLRLAETFDPGPLRRIVEVATRRGYDVRALGPDELDAVAALEALTAADYPSTPATDVPARTPEVLAAMDATYVGALRDGALTAVTAVVPGPGRVETAFTSVHPDHRRRGLAAAVKAASVLLMAEGGARLFGTGGASVNAGSLAMNRRVGYVVTERWLSLAPPGRDGPA